MTNAPPPPPLWASRMSDVLGFLSALTLVLAQAILDWSLLHTVMVCGAFLLLWLAAVIWFALTVVAVYGWRWAQRNLG